MPENELLKSDAMDLNEDIIRKHRIHFKKINEELTNTLTSQVPLIEDIGKHALLGDGKRLRPLFFILSCQLCNYQGKDVHRLSTIFEYIHSASLLHDDVIDNSMVRRRKASINHLWGNHTAILEGDFLASKSSSIAVGSNNMLFLKKITETSTQMVEGQVRELIHTDDWETSKEQYMEIITAKTGALISAACSSGAIISGALGEAEESLAKFGMKAGIAFQLVDDLLDYTSSEELFGKPVGKDLKEGKITLPLIYTLPKLEVSERKRLVALFKNRQATEEDYQVMTEFVRGSGAIDQVLNEAQFYVDKAANCLSPFPDSSAKRDLLNLSQHIIERKH